MLEFTGGAVPVFADLVRDGQVPPWFGHDAVHRSHQSSLVRKEPEHYRRHFPDVPDDLPYVWPAAAFPRWPVRRAGSDALELPAALALLGLTEAYVEQAGAVAAARAGVDHRLELPPGGGATTAGLLAALCTSGQTLWVTPGADLPSVPLPQRPDVPPPATSKVSASIARPPDDAATAAMRIEAAAEPEFRFLRPAQVTPAAAAGATRP